VVNQTVFIDFGKTSCDAGTAYYVQDNGAGFEPPFVRRPFGAFHRPYENTDSP